MEGTARDAPVYAGVCVHPHTYTHACTQAHRLDNSPSKDHVCLWEDIYYILVKQDSSEDSEDPEDERNSPVCTDTYVGIYINAKKIK